MIQLDAVDVHKFDVGYLRLRVPSLFFFFKTLTVNIFLYFSNRKNSNSLAENS